MSDRERFLRELEGRLRLRGPRRADALAELDSHIDDGLAAGEGERELVARLGDPAELARGLNRADGRRLDGFVAAAALLTVLAIHFALASLNPLSAMLGYRDSPLGLYLTMAGLGLVLAVLFATAAALVASARVRRSSAGWAALVALAAAATGLPHVLLAWTTESPPVAWAFLVTDWIAWLLVPALPAGAGLLVQGALLVTATIGVVALARPDGVLRRPGSASAGRGYDVAIVAVGLAAATAVVAASVSATVWLVTFGHTPLHPAQPWWTDDAATAVAFAGVVGAIAVVAAALARGRDRRSPGAGMWREGAG